MKLNQSELKLKRSQNVQKDIDGDRLKKTVSRRDKKKVKEKELLKEKEKVQWVFL
jgi:hypothetical protein